MTVSSPTAANKKSERTRRQILDAAARLFREQGYAATTLRQIALRAKIKAGSIYYYFSSKDQILDEVLDLGIRVVADAVRAAVDALPDSTSARERIGAAVRTHLLTILTYSDYASAHIRIYGQVPKAVQQRNQAIRSEYTRYWNGLLLDARERGEIDPKVDISVTRVFLLGSMNWTVEWYDPKGKPIEELAADFCNTVFEGIGAR